MFSADRARLWIRVADMDVWAEIPGAFFAVEEGSVNADTIWLCTANSGGTLGTTAGYVSADSDFRWTFKHEFR